MASERADEKAGPKTGGPPPTLTDSRAAPADVAPEAKNPFAGDDFTPRRQYPPLEGVENASISQDDMMAFISAAVDYSGLVGHNTNSFNELMDKGIPADHHADVPHRPPGEERARADGGRTAPSRRSASRSSSRT